MSAAAALAVHAAAMFALGTLAASVGSLAGLGGGFIVGPALRIFFHRSPEAAASAALLLVLANVASASLAFLRQGRVDVPLALTMGALAIPGSIAGALVVAAAPATWFDVLYAGLLAYFALSLLRHSSGGASGTVVRLPWARPRVFADRVSGAEYVYAQSPPLAAAAGIATGFLSSFFGIGGGILVVPLLLRVFAMPAHIAAATSLAVILCSVPFGIATHVVRGSIVWSDALPLAAGGLVGGHVGANLSRRLSGALLVRIVGIALAAVAATLVVQQVLTLVPGRR